MSAVAGPPVGGFRRYWLAVLVSALGTWAAFIALALRLYDDTQSEGWLAALFLAEFLPPVVVALFAASLLDRLTPRVALVGGDVVRAAVFAALVVVDEPVAVIGLCGAAGFATGVFGPVSLAAVPRLVPDRELDGANGALAAADNVTTLLGTALGGLAVAVIGVPALLAANAVTFLVSAGLIASIAVLGAASPPFEGAVAGFGVRLGRGLAAVRAHPTLLGIAVTWTVAAVAIGTFNALLVPLLRGVLDAGSGLTGLVVGCTGLGLIVGSLVAARLGRRLEALFPLVLVLMGAGVAVAGLAPAAALVAVAVASMGLGNGLAIVHNRSGVQRSAEPNQRAAVFSLLVGATSLATAVGAAAAAPLAALVGVRGAFVAAGLLVVVVAAPLSVRLRRRPASAPIPAAGAD